MDTSKFVSARIAEVWRNMFYRPTEISDNPKVVYENPDFLYFGDIGNRYACTISIDHISVSGSYEIINVNEDFGSTQIRMISGTESLAGEVFWVDSEELLSGEGFSVYEDASLEQEVEGIEITTEVPTPTVKGWYGVVVHEEDPNPEAVIRIASDMTLHASLPIQSGMKRCVLNSDGTVNYYLDANDSTLKADRTAAKLGGEDGDVMVEVPEHWVLVTKEDSLLTVKLAMEEGALEGAQRVPLHYISAYQANVDGMMICSVSDSAATGNLNIGEFRKFATAKGDGWSQMTYDYAVDLYWLFLVEYANRDSQAAVNNSLTPEGYRQGGLGMGCTYVDSISDYPAVNNGVTNSLGNNSGEISGVTPLSGSGTATVNSYRGIENPFGNLYTFYDGIVNIYGNIYRAADIADYKSFFYEATGDTTMDYAGGEVIVTPDGNSGYLYYLCVAPSTTGDKLSDDTKFEPTDMATLGYTLDATYTSDKFSGYMSAVNNGNLPLGSILASKVDGTESTGYCDYSDVPAASLYCVYGGGYVNDYEGVAPSFGLACVLAYGSDFGSASADFGSRLCYTA